MIKVEYGNAIRFPIRMADIPISTVFTGNIGMVTSLFVKSFSGIIDLANPNHTWDRSANNEVRDYKEVDIIIKVQEK